MDKTIDAIQCLSPLHFSTECESIYIDCRIQQRSKYNCDEEKYFNPTFPFFILYYVQYCLQTVFFNSRIIQHGQQLQHGFLMWQQITGRMVPVFQIKEMDTDALVSRKTTK